MRNDSNLSFTSADSESSLDQLVSPTPPHTPLKGSGGGIGGPKPTSILKNRQQLQQEDLYQWMAKQQDGFKVGPGCRTALPVGCGTLRVAWLIGG